MTKHALIDFDVKGQNEGLLIALEKGTDFPFDIKRVFYIWDLPEDKVRGRHAHRTNEQVVVCMCGSCDFTVDTGFEKITYHLDTPTQGLYLPPLHWGEFTNFSSDCMIMVLASEYYVREEYIHDYDEFLKLTEKRS